VEVQSHFTNFPTEPILCANRSRHPIREITQGEPISTEALIRSFEARMLRGDSLLKAYEETLRQYLKAAEERHGG
jgi:hypothetical protein